MTLLRVFEFIALITVVLALATVSTSVTSAASASTSASSIDPISPNQPPYRPIVHPLPLSPYWSPSLHAPFPTNEWWQNLVLVPSDQPVVIGAMSMRIQTVDTMRKLQPYNRTLEYEHCHTDRFGTHCPEWNRHRDDYTNSSYDLNSLPLLTVTSKRGCNFGLPQKHTETDLVATYFQPGFVMSAVESLSSHQVMKYDDLSVTLQFVEQGEEEEDDPNRINFPLVRGMPYATAIYTQMTPFLFTQNAILNVNGQDLPGTVQGGKLRVMMNNEQTVLVYATRMSDDDGGSSEDVDADDAPQWSWDRNTLQIVGPGSPKGNWVIRMAFLTPSPNSINSDFDDPVEQAYDEYSSVYPIGGSFEMQISQGNSQREENEEDDDTENDDETEAKEYLRVTITYDTASTDSVDPASSDLLMLTLPHHRTSLVKPLYIDAIMLDSLLGDMTGVIGTQWNLEMKAVPRSYTKFRSPRTIDPSLTDTIRSQVIRDIQQSSNAGEPDPYGFGKSVSKLGRMLLVGEEVGVNEQLLQDLLEKMKQYLVPWLSGTNSDALLYDTLYGGIVSTNGIADQGADFGQGWYNDHHFHYGYILYGCAVVAKYDVAWVEMYRENIFALLRDYANPSSSDPFFPKLRHFSIYDSHSWASGLFVFADGRNQESSSESVNSYYAMMLLGEAMGMKDVSTVGRSLLTMELIGTRTYWHSTMKSTVYPQQFAQNKCIGMKWSDKVVEATWFASGVVYIHGINMLPFTPASELYLTKQWVKEEYPVVVTGINDPGITDEWRGFLYGTHCVIDSQTAWQEILSLTSFDGGNTRSNLMYFCATRPKQKWNRSSSIDGDSYLDTSIEEY